MTFKVKFWGVRGSIACPSADHIRYGGNTSCIEVQIGDRHFVLDAGTGIRGLGMEMQRLDIKTAHILLTHTHWDHINGFPFFVPAYNPDRKIHIMAGHLKDKGGVLNVLASQMDNPMFPVPLEAMQADIKFEDFSAGDHFQLYDDVEIKTAPLRHPNDATGYRINYKGKSACYITDTEHVPGELDQNILGLIDGADLVIYDCTYTEEEYESHVGWGHSTWQEGVKLCQEAGVKQMAIFHHDPEHNDAFMDDIGVQAQKVWDGTFIAKEQEEIILLED
ncbi:MAG: MBL fold metallo-hydrolase [Rhodospirillales bacterium]|nr:MBL fold metallo-hydrolase [Rhodospirillales bacterium]